MNYFKMIFIFSFILFIGSCKEKTEIKPAENAEHVQNYSNTGVSTVEGIHVTTETGTWTGSDDVKSYITPLRVIIDNNSNYPLNINYSNFMLVTDSGKIFAALPPFDIEGEVNAPKIVKNYTPIQKPAFEYRNFRIAPYYSRVYPNFPVYGHSIYFDPNYYRYYASYWSTLHLPTSEMLNMALPEGVLDKGGKVSGFIYFEKVNDNLNNINFRFDLVRADSSGRIGEIKIPYKVKD